MSDDELMAALAAALAPQPIRPSPDELSVLHRALAVRTTDRGGVDRRLSELAHRAASIATGWVHGARHPIAVLGAAAILATGGAAAAGVATNTLPGSTRAVAFDLGLPVTSPSLVAANISIEGLRRALLAESPTQVRSAAASLRHELTFLDSADLGKIGQEADQLLAQSDVFLETKSVNGHGDGGGTEILSEGGGANSARSHGQTDPSDRGAGPGTTGSSGSGEGRSDTNGDPGGAVGDGGSGAHQTPSGPENDGHVGSSGTSAGGQTSGPKTSSNPTAGGTSDGTGSSSRSGSGPSGSGPDPTVLEGRGGQGGISAEGSGGTSGTGQNGK